MTVKFIAEIGSNHNRDLKRILELINQAKEIGCWAVKFQLFKAETLYAPEFKIQIEKMKQWELPFSFLCEIRKECNRLDLKFICTPFDLDAVKWLHSCVDFFKIGSYEMLWFFLLKAIIETKVPWIYSTGMVTQMSEITWPIAMGEDYKNLPYAILHCNSNYPAKPEHCNLSQIQVIKKIILDKETERIISSDYTPVYPMKTQVGWSDHTRCPELVLAAIGQGAEIVEFHFDLEDGKGFESEVGHCWKPAEARQLINRAKFHKQIGNKYPSKIEWIFSKTMEQTASKWRTDPEDGLRPLKKYREELLK